MHPPRVESVFSPVCEIPAVKLCQPSKPEVLGTRLPGAELLGWEGQCGALDFSPLRKEVYSCVYLLCVGPDYTVSLPLPPILVSFLSLYL